MLNLRETSSGECTECRVLDAIFQTRIEKWFGSSVFCSSLGFTLFTPLIFIDAINLSEIIVQRASPKSRRDVCPFCVLAKEASLLAQFPKSPWIPPPSLFVLLVRELRKDTTLCLQSWSAKKTRLSILWLELVYQSIWPCHQFEMGWTRPRV